MSEEFRGDRVWLLGVRVWDGEWTEERELRAAEVAGKEPRCRH